jgi:hypothetical protein
MMASGVTVHGDDDTGGIGCMHARRARVAAARFRARSSCHWRHGTFCHLSCPAAASCLIVERGQIQVWRYSGGSPGLAGCLVFILWLSWSWSWPRNVPLTRPDRRSPPVPLRADGNVEVAHHLPCHPSRLARRAIFRGPLGDWVRRPRNCHGSVGLIRAKCERSIIVRRVCWHGSIHMRRWWLEKGSAPHKGHGSVGPNRSSYSASIESSR